MRGLFVVALCGCVASDDVTSTPQPLPHWAIAPAPSVWPLGRVSGRIGRGVAPQWVTARGIAGDGPPLADATVWSIDGSPVVASGMIAGTPIVEVYDVDAGTRSWRASCGAPVVGLDAKAIVCGDQHGVTTLQWSGKPGWSSPLPFVAKTGPRVMLGDGSVHDVTGAELFTVHGHDGSRVLAVCDREVLAVLADQRLARFSEAKPQWTLALAKGDSIVSIDGCEATMLVTVAGDRGTALVAISHDGKLLGRVDDVRGVWPARSGSAIEVATSSGVAKMDRALATSTRLDLPPLGALLAARGDRRLVRASPTTAVVLDHTGVRAYVPLPEASAALGDDHVLASSSRWFALPRPWTGRVHVPTAHPVMVPAELRDLPSSVTPTPASSQLAFGTQVIGIAVFATHLYVATDAGIAHLDLATLTWGWQVAISGVRMIAANVDHVVIATAATVSDYAPDGTKRWDHDATGTLEVAGDIVRIGDLLLDAPSGALVATVPHATLVPLDETAIVISAEANRIVARMPAARMLPVWSVEVAGVVTSLQRSSDGVLVTLEDGDAYRLDARSGDAVAIAGIGLVWRATGNAITGEAPGGPVPGVIKPPVLPPEIYKPTDLEVAPAIATPWPSPPPLPASWQLTVYGLDGGVRARNDYELAGARPALRIANAPLVYVSGTTALVVDPVHGHPLRRVALPETGVAFSAIVDGRAVVGTIVAAPLRVVVF